MTPVNIAEQYAYALARRSSLTLWSYANPRRDDGRELCDVLILFGTNLAILSVKDIAFTGPGVTALARWQRRAIDDSAKQLYGAEKAIRSSSAITRSDGTQGLPLPPIADVSIHRIAVALGSEGRAPFPSGDLGKGFVHVFDDKAFDIILTELDTPADLFAYLNAKLRLASSASNIHFEGGEEDLLAHYLVNGRSFPPVTGLITLGEGLWTDFTSRPEYSSRKEANKDSAIWDGLIETVAGHALSGTLEFGGSLTDTERGLRYMAAEDRYQRRVLGRAFEDFLKGSATNLRSRMVASSSGTTYVFLATPHGTDREQRGNELLGRCFAARGKIRHNKTVVGIATEQYVKDAGFSLDVGVLVKDEWTDEDQKALDDLLRTAAFFMGEPRIGYDQPEYPT